MIKVTYTLWETLIAIYTVNSACYIGPTISRTKSTSRQGPVEARPFPTRAEPPGRQLPSTWFHPLSNFGTLNLRYLLARQLEMLSEKVSLLILRSKIMKQQKFSDDSRRIPFIIFRIGLFTVFVQINLSGEAQTSVELLWTFLSGQNRLGNYGEKILTGFAK
uniref:Uncharacterized protein n=1 Tax=Romanomermis culicivorax TaxID=13658 RepID=A0A915L7K2_ROMCU